MWRPCRSRILRAPLRASLRLLYTMCWPGSMPDSYLPFTMSFSLWAGYWVPSAAIPSMSFIFVFTAKGKIWNSQLRCKYDALLLSISDPTRTLIWIMRCNIHPPARSARNMLRIPSICHQQYAHQVWCRQGTLCQHPGVRFKRKNSTWMRASWQNHPFNSLGNMLNN